MFDIVAVLFVLASVLGFLNYRYIKLPFAIGITASAMVASFLAILVDKAFPQWGLAAALAEAMQQIDFAETLMHGMLSFLLFAGAMHVDMDRLKVWASSILTMATVGVLMSTALIGAGTYFLLDLLGMPVAWPFCLLFGALISPTDPVAVLGIMKAAGAPKDVETKVIGESLFNDGVGVVLYTVLLAVAMTSIDPSLPAVGPLEVVILLLKEVIGGVLLGLAGGALAYMALCRVDEPNLETLISVSMVMGITFVAFRLHTSAPLAAVIAGLFIGTRGRSRAMGHKTREHLDIIWGFVDEALNAVLFLLIGLEILVIEWKSGYWLAAAAMIALNLGARAISVFVPLSALRAARRLTLLPGTRRILIWGGLKGGISIALALSMPDFQGRSVILSMTYAIVVSSIVVQGLTIGKLIKRVVPPEALKGAETGH